MNTIKLPQLAWFGAKELELGLPDSWDVEICNMAGYDRRALKPEEIKEKLTALRKAREKAEQELTKAQEELRKVLTLHQEARLVLIGFLK